MTTDMKPLAVLTGMRTPMAKAFTSLRAVSAVELGRAAMLAALQRASLPAERIDEVIFGSVSGQSDAANLARVIALRSGVPQASIAHTVNRNCASGMEAIIAAWHSILHRPSNGEAPRLVVAGGTESMSNIPMIYTPQATDVFLRLGKARTLGQKLSALAAFRPRHFKPLLGIELGLTDPVCGLNMGQTAEVLAEDFSITRQQQDEFALASHQRAIAAREDCFLSGEIVPLPAELAGGKQVTQDNGPRDAQSLDQLAKLRPLFQPTGGTVTAGNSCPLTDGAAALLLADAEAVAAGRLGDIPQPLGYITAYEIAGCDPRRMGLGPVYALAKLLRRTGLRLHDFDRIEINEAFAAQVIACRRAAESAAFCREQLGMDGPLGGFDAERTNVHGGAIALGHPVGMSGTRLLLTLLRTLRHSGLRRGVATLCVGGGQGVAMMVETPEGR